MFKKLNSYLYPLIIFNLFYHTAISHNNLLPNREMVILLETIDAENLETTLNASNKYIFRDIPHPVGIGAITITLLHALYQKAAPIIANKSLIKNIIDHQNLFSDFTRLDRNSLYNKYGRYTRFQGHLTLDNFMTNCRYIKNTLPEIHKIFEHIPQKATTDAYKILEKIIKDKRFNIRSAPWSIQQLNRNESAMGAFMLEMIVYTLCTWINFQEWEIRQVNEDIFLLIPADYLKKLGINHSQEKLPLSQENNQLLTSHELKSGLKIDHMPTMQRSFFEKPLTSSKEIPFKTSLSQIFVTEENIKNTPNKQNTKCIWSLYMTGHGHPRCPQIELLPQLNDLKKLYTKKLKDSKFKACLAYEKNKSKNSNHKSICKDHTKCLEYINIIKQLNKELKRTEPFRLSADKRNQGIICSLSIEEFQDSLKFFNNNITTAFLYYTSCFAGGNHYVHPYMEKDKPLIFNFPIISGTIAENMSIQEFPNINLPPYTNSKRSIAFEPSDIHILDIDQANKTLKLHTTLHFNKFFTALRNGAHNHKEKLILIPYSLHPHINKFGEIRSEIVSNIPLIRFAGSKHFELIPGDKSFTLINSNNATQPIKVDRDPALIYSNYVGKITLNKISKYQDIPQFISMIPGFALHTFEEINSSTLNLQEIVNSFLTFPELAASKIFWIKKLECPKHNFPNSRKEILKDVIIMRNVFNSNTLSRCSHGQHSIPLENCAYFSVNTKQKPLLESKLVWNGPFIENNNFKIMACKQSSHKEECLNCFPQAKNFLNPVLQNI